MPLMTVVDSGLGRWGVPKFIKKIMPPTPIVRAVSRAAHTTAGRAIIGGAILGGPGAILGAATSRASRAAAARLAQRARRVGVQAVGTMRKAAAMADRYSPHSLAYRAARGAYVNARDRAGKAKAVEMAAENSAEAEGQEAAVAQEEAQVAQQELEAEADQEGPQEQAAMKQAEDEAPEATGRRPNAKEQEEIQYLQSRIESGEELSEDEQNAIEKAKSRGFMGLGQAEGMSTGAKVAIAGIALLIGYSMFTRKKLIA